MPRVEPMDLVYSLVGFPSETEWLEFKRDNTNPETIARDISALANSAAYCGRDAAYKVWGVDDASHKLVGTTFDPNSSKKGNVLLPIWLKQVLTDNANYDFFTATNGKHRFVILTVRPAVDRPVYYDGKAYVREGSSSTQLVPGSAKEQRLWHRLQRFDYESRIALKGLTPHEVSELLDIEFHFRLLGDSQPTTVDAAMAPLCEQGILRKQDDGLFSITNLGMLLIARKLSSFPGARHHILRATRFAGNANLDTSIDATLTRGMHWRYRRPVTMFCPPSPPRTVLRVRSDASNMRTRHPQFASCCRTSLRTKILQTRRQGPS